MSGRHTYSYLHAIKEEENQIFTPSTYNKYALYSPHSEKPESKAVLILLFIIIPFNITTSWTTFKATIIFMSSFYTMYLIYYQI